MSTHRRGPKDDPSKGIRKYNSETTQINAWVKENSRASIPLGWGGHGRISRALSQTILSEDHYSRMLEELQLPETVRAVRSRAVPKGPWSPTAEEKQDLITKAIAAATSTPKTRILTVKSLERKKAIRLATIANTHNGTEFICQGCGWVATYTDAGMPLLEEHHIGDMSKGTPDDLRFTVGLCGRCHDIATRGAERVQFNEDLRAKIKGV